MPSLADISAYLYDSEDDPLIQAALVHYQFEMIHPFEKYNGIVGRILIFMVLKKIAGKALSGLCLSEHLFFNKNEYFDILSSSNTAAVTCVGSSISYGLSMKQLKLV